MLCFKVLIMRKHIFTFKKKTVLPLFFLQSISSLVSTIKNYGKKIRGASKVKPIVSGATVSVKINQKNCSNLK